MNHHDTHLSAERMQAFLDGELGPARLGDVEEHLAACARCAAELEGWRVLYEDLSGLADHVPATGFSERVLAGLPAVAEGHVSAEELQDHLEGLLSPASAAAVEVHLSECARCADEASAWAGVVAALDGTSRFGPRTGFADTVMAAVELPVRTPLAARVAARLRAALPGRATAHVDASRLQDLLDGSLTTRQVARIRTHLGDCAVCAGEARAWKGVMARLDELERFAPGRELAGPVLAAVAATNRAPAVPNPLLAAARSTARATARRVLPKTKEAWAALSGVAVTPAVVGGLVLYVIFSHPAVTVGSLASFAWWQLTDLAGSAWSLVSTATLESGRLLDIYALLDTLAAAPLAVAGGVVLYTLASAAALRVLYKHLNVYRPAGGRYARFTTS